MERDTKQRMAIRHVFEKHPARALSPQELHAEAGVEHPSIGIATVYRNVKEMVADGELVPVQLPGMPDRYQRTCRRLPHVLIDETSGRVATFTVSMTPIVQLPDGSRPARIEIIAYGKVPDAE